MKSLFNILESILSNGEKITQDLVGEEATARFHYQLFMDYVGSLLYKKTPYSFFPSFNCIDFELSTTFQYPHSPIGYVYGKCEDALVEYFKEIKRIHSKSYVIAWYKKTGQGQLTYELNIKNKETGKRQVVDFMIKNILDSRRIRVVWEKNKPFMLP